MNSSFPLRHKFLSIVLLIFVCGRACLHADPAVYREFYVSPSGADGNPGTQAHPFKTLTQARDAVCAASPQMNGDIVVYLRGGTYPITAPLEFGVANSGQNGFNVVYRAFEKEKPVLSGGVQVTGWSLDHDNVYKATLDRDDKLRCIFVNGVRAQMTQADFQGQGAWGTFEIKGDEPWADTPGKTLDGVRFKASEVQMFANPDEVELLQAKVWNFHILGVRDMAREGDQTIVKLQQPLGAIAATMRWNCNLNPKGKFTIQNAYELLKNPGEFYFNHKTHALYYIPRPGEDMATAEVIAPSGKGLLRITGDSTEKRAGNLVFTGLKFCYDDWSLFKVGDSHGATGVQSLAYYTRFRSDGNHHVNHYAICDLPQGAVEVRNATNVAFLRNRFIDLSSGSAISFVNDVTNSQIVGNIFQDDSGNAINIGHPQHYVADDSPLFPKGIDGVCANIKITNNLIRNVSSEFKQEEAISGFCTQGVQVLHNDIASVPYGGIFLGWGWGDNHLQTSTVPKDNVISFNRVVDTQKVLPADGGAIYVLGEQRNGQIENNYIDSVGANLYPDDGSAYWTIRNNVTQPHPGPDAGHNNKWLFIWTPRCHDMTIDNNYTTLTAGELNKGTHTPGTNTHREFPFPAEAQTIIDASGLEPAYKDIALE